MHQTTAFISVVSNDGAGNVELDFAGWSVNWNGITDIPMGGDPTNFPSDTGLAIMICTVDCADGDTYTVDYVSHVPLGDLSSFGGVGYAWHLSGTVSGALPAVPNDALLAVYSGSAVSVSSLDNDVDADSDMYRNIVTLYRN